MEFFARFQKVATSQMKALLLLEAAMNQREGVRAKICDFLEEVDPDDELRNYHLDSNGNVRRFPNVESSETDR